MVESEKTPDNCKNLKISIGEIIKKSRNTAIRY